MAEERRGGWSSHFQSTTEQMFYAIGNWAIGSSNVSLCYNRARHLRRRMSQTSFAEADIRPLRVGRHLWVGPHGSEPPDEPSLVPIWLEPGPAFGTGAHPTTQLCLRALERHLKPGVALLDLGAGSG